MAELTLGQFWYWWPAEEFEEVKSSPSSVMEPVNKEHEEAQGNLFYEQIKLWNDDHPDKAQKGDYFNEVLPYWEQHEAEKILKKQREKRGS